METLRPTQPPNGPNFLSISYGTFLEIIAKSFVAAPPPRVGASLYGAENSGSASAIKNNLKKSAWHLQLNTLKEKDNNLLLAGHFVITHLILDPDYHNGFQVWTVKENHPPPKVFRRDLVSKISEEVAHT